jgi:hypothetical protein
MTTSTACHSKMCMPKRICASRSISRQLLFAARPLGGRRKPLDAAIKYNIRIGCPAMLGSLDAYCLSAPLFNYTKGSVKAATNVETLLMSKLYHDISAGTCVKLRVVRWATANTRRRSRVDTAVRLRRGDGRRLDQQAKTDTANNPKCGLITRQERAPLTMECCRASSRGFRASYVVGARGRAQRACASRAA